MDMEDEEEKKDKDRGLIGDPMKTTTITIKDDQETQHEVVDKPTQDQRMINQTFNAIFLRSLVIMHLNVELL